MSPVQRAVIDLVAALAQLNEASAAEDALGAVRAMSEIHDRLVDEEDLLRQIRPSDEQDIRYRFAVLRARLILERWVEVPSEAGLRAATEAISGISGPAAVILARERPGEPPGPVN